MGMGGDQTGMLGVGVAGETVGTTDNDGLHWALLGARKHNVVSPPKCQGGLALLRVNSQPRQLWASPGFSLSPRGSPLWPP